MCWANNVSITKVGTAVQRSVSPFSSGGGSVKLNGSGDYLTTPRISGFDLSTGDFTIEAWVYFNSFAANNRLVGLGQGAIGGGPYTGWALNVVNSGAAVSLYRYDGTETAVQTNYAFSTKQWYHVAVSRSGTTLKIFVNGVQVLSTSNSLSYSGVNSDPLYVGAQYDGAGGNGWKYLNGYVTNIRITKGAALYTTNFSVPTLPLPITANTQLLLKFDSVQGGNNNTIVDSSDFHASVTRNGSPVASSISPFTGSGGSVYFNGTTDYLTVPSSNAFDMTGDFTAEGWVYMAAIPGSTNQVTILGQETSNYLKLAISPSGAPCIVQAGVAIIASGATLPLNTWKHVAMTRSGSSSNNLKLFVDGTLVDQTTYNTSVSSANNTVIGRFTTSFPYFTGYMSNVGYVKGVAKYTGNFSVPTAPLSVHPSTSLLIKGESAQVIDASRKNPIITNSNSSISAVTKKYGTGSIAFNGGTDYLSMVSSQNVPIGTEQFTIEGWIYRNATGTDHGIFSIGSLGSDTTIRVKGSSNVIQIWFNGSGAYANGSTIISSGQWYHIAWVRSGTNSKVYVNGILDINYTDTSVGTSLTARAAVIGATYANAPEAEFNGFIDEFRITRGVVRYTAPFTPPTASFPTA